MKKLNFLLFSLTLLSGCSLTANSNFVYYKSVEPVSCNLVMGLSHEAGEHKYQVTTNTNSATGNFIKEGQQIIFSGLYAFESPANSKIEVSALQQGDTLTIQNYGNSANSFTLFPECQSKYLSLVKVTP